MKYRKLGKTGFNVSEISLGTWQVGGKWGSGFDDAHWTDKSKLSDERLKDLVEHMSKIKVGNVNYSADVMGDSYEYLIKKFADLSKNSTHRAR